MVAKIIDIIRANLSFIVVDFSLKTMSVVITPGQNKIGIANGTTAISSNSLAAFDSSFVVFVGAISLPCTMFNAIMSSTTQPIDLIAGMFIQKSFKINPHKNTVIILAIKIVKLDLNATSLIWEYLTSEIIIIAADIGFSMVIREIVLNKISWTINF